MTPMTEPFVPDKPQKEVLVKINKREAVLIQKLRKYPYGKFLVHKVNNRLIRIEINDSQLIDEDTEIDIDR